MKIWAAPFQQCDDAARRDYRQFIAIPVTLGAGAEVFWRKTSFGVQSARGRKFIERVLTVRARCRLQGVRVAEFVRNAVAARRNGGVAPSFLTEQIQTTTSWNIE